MASDSLTKHLVGTDLWRFSLQSPHLLNVYLAGDVLIDAGTPGRVRELVAALKDHPPAAHALTHAHVDHHGGSHAVCEAFGAPLWCGAGDRIAVETGEWTSLLPQPDGWIARVARPFSAPGHPVARVLEEGDRVGDFTVVETPGHTPGHLAFWRPRDRILILGDVLFHRNPVSRRLRLREPFSFATREPSLNRESARRLAALEPLIVCFGHGEPLTDADRFQEFVADLPP